MISTVSEWLLYESLSLAIKLFLTIRNDLNRTP